MEAVEITYHVVLLLQYFVLIDSEVYSVVARRGSTPLHYAQRALPQPSSWSLEGAQALSSFG
jgi:hypothetical protein